MIELLAFVEFKGSVVGNKGTMSHNIMSSSALRGFVGKELTAWRESFLPRLHRDIDPRPPVVDPQGQIALKIMRTREDAIQ